MSKDPLEGMTLEKILNVLVETYGWEELGQDIRINCFHNNPSLKSSLHFLRRTPWARAKVEEFYLWHVRRAMQEERSGKVGRKEADTNRSN